MYAVIESGGKQYRVAVGDRVKVESLKADAGATVALDKVLVVAGTGDVQIGAPHLDGVTVEAKVVSHGRGDKIRVFKMKRRKDYRRTYGHRQNFTELEILSIGGEAKTKPVDAAVSEPAAKSAPAEVSDVRDDLSKINGIGPKIKERLYELGITTFAQIATLTDTEIEHINGQLSFKGRIQRENWVEQAKALADDAD
ncbi:MAG: 50S ribosomal protein L21 [Gammaproteobacteria bacterium]|nr:50S ribosomal protein L21 [Gammaproteobacteria bacterium]MDH3467838.1 50S ribosomal protein L21 [Gammaproteobacteria bacterium]